MPKKPDALAETLTDKCPTCEAAFIWIVLTDRKGDPDRLPICKTCFRKELILRRLVKQHGLD